MVVDWLQYSGLAVVDQLCLTSSSVGLWRTRYGSSQGSSVIAAMSAALRLRSEVAASESRGALSVLGRWPYRIAGEAGPCVRTGAGKIANPCVDLGVAACRRRLAPRAPAPNRTPRALILGVQHALTNTAGEFTQQRWLHIALQ